jgi:quercetin dioxygenase-like cupin family protein
MDDDRASAFVLRAVAVEPGCERVFDEAEWRDAIVSVARGEIELEARSGARRRFGTGDVLCLDGLPLRALRCCSPEPVLLLAVSRRSFSSPPGV